MTPILQHLSIEAYRGIFGLELAELSPVSLFVGANNAGKSSILEAAGLLLRPPDPSQWVSMVRHRDAEVSLIDGLWAAFPDSEALHVEDGPQQSKPIALSGTTSGAARRIEARCVATESLGSTEVADLSARIEVSVNGQPAVTLRFPAPPAVSHQVPMFRIFEVTPATHYSSKAMVEHLSRVIDEGKKELTVELLQVFDNDVTGLDVSALPKREAVRVTHAKRGVVDLASFGDGMRRSAALALALTRASQGVLLIDEIEAGVHPSVLRSVLGKLLEAAASAQVQLLATTHSLEAVDALVEAAGDRDGTDSLAAYWVQRKDGRHEGRRYDYERLQRMREGGLDIR